MPPLKRKPVVVITALGKNGFSLRYPAATRALLDLNRLCDTPGVTEASFLPAGRELRVTFAPGKFKLDRFAGKLEAAGANVVVKQGAPSARSAAEYDEQAPYGGNMLAAFLGELGRGANRGVRGRLNNSADLTSLAPVLLGLLGTVAFVRQPLMPKWNEFMWYAYSIFRDFHGKSGV